MALLSGVDAKATRAFLHLPANDRVQAFIPELRAGFPATTVEWLSSELELPASTLWEYLGLAARTLARRRPYRKRRLSSEESSRILRVGAVLAAATNALGSIEKARSWLRKKSLVLGDVPLRMLDTDIGASLVLDEIGRMEHGVFA
jgi:putative toxin-antitoxin system antitoxin component (TIGR02293 family)